MNRKEVSHSSSTRVLRPHSTPATLMWLEENYEMAEGVCVPRNTLYLHYVDFCSKHGMQPVNAASFGKIIRQQFPQLTTRRLGTRGQSRYHYYGIAIRESSPYYELIYSKKGLQAAGDLRKDRQQVTATYSSRSKLATRLPDFPNPRDLCLPPNIPEERVSTFIMMYRAHCQRLLDTIIRASFDEVQTFLLHFWQGMPPHLVGVLGSNVVVNIVGVCDSILYRSVCSILMSSVLRALPETLIQMIRKFAAELDSRLRVAMEDLPENLRAVKIDLARHFCHMLRRQTSLNHIFQAVRLAFHDPQLISVLLHDWRRQDLPTLVKGALQAAAHFAAAHDHPAATSDTHQLDSGKRRNDVAVSQVAIDFMGGLCIEFERLVQEQAPVEALSEWFESIIDRCVVQQVQRRRIPLRRAIQQFLVTWNVFAARLLRDLTLQSAPSFGTFHLIRVMIDDFLFYLVELLHVDDRARELMHNIALDAPPEYLESDYESFVSGIFSSSSNGDLIDLRSEMNSRGSPNGSTTFVTYTTTGEDTNSGVADEDNSTSNHQMNLANDYLPPNGNEPVVVTGSSETCNGYSYDYDPRVPGNYKFPGSDSSGACRNYAAYPGNPTTAQACYPVFNGTSGPEYGTYGTEAYVPIRRGPDYNAELCSIPFFAESLVGSNTTYTSPAPVVPPAGEFYCYETPDSTYSNTIQSEKRMEKGTEAPTVVEGAFGNDTSVAKPEEI